MKLKLKACSPLNTNWNLEYGTLVLKDNILLKFIENTENINFLKMKYGEQYFPIRPNTYTVNFLNEISEHHENFKATIRIKDSLVFYVKLNWLQKQKLKWMHKQNWIQKPENIWKFIVFVTGTILAVIGLLYTT